MQHLYPCSTWQYFLLVELFEFREANSVAHHPSQMNAKVISSPLSGCDVSISTLFIPRSPDCLWTYLSIPWLPQQRSVHTYRNLARHRYSDQYYFVLEKIHTLNFCPFIPLNGWQTHLHWIFKRYVGTEILVQSLKLKCTLLTARNDHQSVSTN